MYSDLGSEYSMPMWMQTVGDEGNHSWLGSTFRLEKAQFHSFLCVPYKYFNDFSLYIMLCCAA